VLDFGLGVHYDGDIQRLIVEARDPVSAGVIFQVPQKYVTEQFARLPASIERVRGTGVDRAVELRDRAAHLLPDKFGLVPSTTLAEVPLTKKFNVRQCAFATSAAFSIVNHCRKQHRDLFAVVR
jgi:hypothetical protein